MAGYLNYTAVNMNSNNEKCESEVIESALQACKNEPVDFEGKQVELSTIGEVGISSKPVTTRSCETDPNEVQVFRMSSAQQPNDPHRDVTNSPVRAVWHNSPTVVGVVYKREAVVLSPKNLITHYNAVSYGDDSDLRDSGLPHVPEKNSTEIHICEDIQAGMKQTTPCLASRTLNSDVVLSKEPVGVTLKLGNEDQQLREMRDHFIRKQLEVVHLPKIKSQNCQDRRVGCCALFQFRR